MGDASVMMDITLLMDFASNVPMEAGITKSLRNVMTSAQGHIKFILLLGVFVKMATSWLLECVADALIGRFTILPPELVFASLEKKK